MSLAAPSRTAIMPGILRAQHQTIDADPKILIDPIAATLFDEAAVTLEHEWIKIMPEEFITYLRSTLVLRSGIAEQYLAEAVQNGVPQYLILAAGMDTFGFRQPDWARHLQIREIDHPLSQAYKRERVAAAGHQVPDNLQFIPIDFTQETMAEGLARAGLDPTRPVFASWLGCAMYLTEAQIIAAMRPLAAWPGGASVIATFIGEDWSEFEPGQQALLKVSRDGAGTIGEPWHFVASEAATTAVLRDAGFATVRRLSRAEIERRCHFPRQDKMTLPFEMLFYASTAPEQAAG